MNKYCTHVVNVKSRLSTVKCCSLIGSEKYCASAQTSKFHK